MARSTAEKPLTFFISHRVPNWAAPSGITETLTSQRIDPSCILQSEISKYWRMARMESR